MVEKSQLKLQVNSSRSSRGKGEDGEEMGHEKMGWGNYFEVGNGREWV